MLEYRLEEEYKPRKQESGSNLNDFFCWKINFKEWTGLYIFSTGKAFKIMLEHNFDKIIFKPFSSLSPSNILKDHVIFLWCSSIP